MPNLIFAGAFIRHFDGRRDAGGTYCRIHATADFSVSVRDGMGWEPVPDCVTQSKLSGRLSASHMILTPNDKLAKHELQLGIDDVSDFQLHRVKSDDGETLRSELRFIARSRTKCASGMVQNYIDLVGEDQAQLRITYTKQEELPLELGAEEEP